MKNIPYEERLQRLKLPTLAYRRTRGDMIEVYKLLHGKYDSDVLSSCTKTVIQMKEQGVIV